jgi:hypothetical protein
MANNERKDEIRASPQNASLIQQEDHGSSEPDTLRSSAIP